eukprot:scaffold11710_cov127-Isochrysis_galbana.AAC.2
MCGGPGGGSGPASLGRGGFPESPIPPPAGALVPPAERLFNGGAGATGIGTGCDCQPLIDRLRDTGWRFVLCRRAAAAAAAAGRRRHTHTSRNAHSTG